jgi:hypothetical protein
MAARPFHCEMFGWISTNEVNFVSLPMNVGFYGSTSPIITAS